MIFYRSLTQKTPFAGNYWANEREVVSHFILRPVLNPGSHLLQISLKALFKYQGSQLNP